jgi:hypothetical protein
MRAWRARRRYLPPIGNIVAVPDHLNDQKESEEIMLHRNLTSLFGVLVLVACADFPNGDMVNYPGTAAVAPPPAARVEVVGVPPAPNWTWAPGHWRLESGQQVWDTGHWIEPQPGQVYVQAYWSKEGNRWVYHEARWQPMPTAQGFVADSAAISATMAPPALRVEQPSPSPGPNYVWINGYWQWQGNQYVWAPGRWEAARPGAYYVPSYWVQDGPNWRFVAGNWVRY